MESREGVDKLKVEGTVYDNAFQQAEVMNKCFHTVFTRESEFRMNNIIAIGNVMEDMKVDIKQSKTTYRKPRKVPDSDGVSN